MIEFRCEVCKELRPQNLIAVDVRDLSKKYNLPPGTMKRNVNFCNYRKSCIDGVKQIEE